MSIGNSMGISHIHPWKIALSILSPCEETIWTKPILLACCPSAINRLCTTGDATGCIRTQIRDQLRHLFRLKQAMDRALGYHDFLHYLGLGDSVDTCLVRDLFLNKWSSHVGGANRIAGDAMLSPFQCRNARQ